MFMAVGIEYRIWLWRRSYCLCLPSEWWSIYILHNVEEESIFRIFLDRPGVIRRAVIAATSALLASSLRKLQRCSHLTDFHKTRYRGLPRKPIDNLQIWLNSDKNIGRFTCRAKYVIQLLVTYVCHKIIFLQRSIILYRWRCSTTHTELIVAFQM